MSLQDILRKKLMGIPGYAGGNLQDQLDEEQMPQQPQEAQQFLTTPPATRPRYVDRIKGTVIRPSAIPDTSNGMMDFRDAGSPPVSMTRDRRTQPQDFVADDSQYLRDVSKKPLGTRDKLGLLSQSIATNLGYKPLPTRRQRAMGQAERQLGADIETQKQQSQQEALKSQIAARKAAVTSGQERIRQGDKRLQQDEARIGQQATIARKRNVASFYNGQREFNPDDPKNAALVAQFQQEFGFPPPKKVSGSLLQVVEGQNPDGSPSFTVIDKGTQTASPVTGNLPAQTTNQINRQERQRQFAVAENGRNRRFEEGQTNTNARAANALEARTAKGAPSASQTKAANTLAARYNMVRKMEMAPTTPKAQKPQIRAQREALWQQVQDTYPGMFDVVNNGELAMKQGQVSPAAQSQDNKPTKSLSAIRSAASNKNLDPDEAERRARARTDITLVP